MVDEDRVLAKLGRLEGYVRRLEEKQDCTLEEYERDVDRRDVVERRFEKAIQASIDVASHVVAAEGLGQPESYGGLFEILGRERVISSETAERMVEMAGFRNVLAHEYADIVDERVYHHLQDLEQFRKFAAEIQEFLDRQ